MLDKASQMAERVATGVSRRAFLGRLGQSALVVAGVLGGFLAFPGEAQAGGSCCLYACSGGVIGPHTRCAKKVQGKCPPLATCAVLDTVPCGHEACGGRGGL
jgi:hypothetical protein